MVPATGELSASCAFRTTSLYQPGKSPACFRISLTKPVSFSSTAMACEYKFQHLLPRSLHRRRGFRLAGAGRAHANSYGLFRLARLDHERDAGRFGHGVSTGVYQPGVLLMDRVDGSSRPAAWHAQVIGCGSGRAPIDAEPAAPIVGNDEIEGRAATDEESVLREPPTGRISGSVRLESAGRREGNPIEHDGVTRRGHGLRADHVLAVQQASSIGGTARDRRQCLRFRHNASLEQSLRWRKLAQDALA